MPSPRASPYDSLRSNGPGASATPDVTDRVALSAGRIYPAVTTSKPAFVEDLPESAETLTAAPKMRRAAGWVVRREPPGKASRCRRNRDISSLRRDAFARAPRMSTAAWARSANTQTVRQAPGRVVRCHVGHRDRPRASWRHLGHGNRAGTARLHPRHGIRAGATWLGSTDPARQAHAPTHVAKGQPG